MISSEWALTCGALCDRVGDSAGTRIGTREAWVSYVGAILTDGGARCGNEEQTADAKSEWRIFVNYGLKTPDFYGK